MDDEKPGDSEEDDANPPIQHRLYRGEIEKEESEKRQNEGDRKSASQGRQADCLLRTALQREPMGRQDRKGGICIRHPEYRTRDAVQKGMGDKGTEEGNGDTGCAKHGCHEALDSQKDTSHGIGMYAGHQSAECSQCNAGGNSGAYCRKHVLYGRTDSPINSPEQRKIMDRGKRYTQMKIAITRLPEKADTDQALCMQYGHECLIVSPLEATAYEGKCREFLTAANRGDFDCIFFTSALPARYLAPELKTDARVIAIGPQTARTLAESGITSEILPTHYSRDFAPYLGEWLRGKTVGIPHTSNFFSR